MRVYVLDDEKVIGVGLSRQLRALGCDAAHADTVEGLLALPAPVDLLIVDFNLCGTDALACAGELEQRFPGTPRVILTAGLLSDEQADGARRAGYREVVGKPLTVALTGDLLARYGKP